MKAMMRMAGAVSLVALLAACGGGGGGGGNGAAGSAPADGAAVVEPVAGPVADPVVDPAAETNRVVVSGGMSALVATGIADATVTVPVASVEREQAALAATDDPTWVPTWNDATLDSYYPSRPIVVQISGSGSVTNLAHGNNGPLCTSGGPVCNLAYSKYETVTLTAYAKTGMKFKGWSGGCIGAGMAPVCQIKNSDAHTVLAVFGPA